MARWISKKIHKIRIQIHLLSDPAVSFEGKPADDEERIKTLFEMMDERIEAGLRSQFRELSPGSDALLWEIRPLSRIEREDILSVAMKAAHAWLAAYRAAATPIGVPEGMEVCASELEVLELGRYIMALSEGKGLGSGPLDVSS